MTAQFNPYAEHAPRLFDLGYSPVPLNGKTPSLRAWNTIQYTNALVERLCGQYPALNVGILTGPVIAIDIDVLDPDLAARLTAEAMRILGQTDFISYGQWPKRALFYRARDRIVVPSVGNVEVLGARRMVAVFGNHPVTQRPYYWPVDCIVDSPREAIPAGDEQSVSLFMEQAAILQGLQPPKSARKKIFSIHRPVAAGQVGRNKALFDKLRAVGRNTRTSDQLLTQAHTENSQFAEPLPQAEVEDVVNSVWGYKAQGKLYGKSGKCINLPLDASDLKSFYSQPRALVLYAMLLKNRPSSGPFTIPQVATASHLGWGRTTVFNSIKTLIQMGRLCEAGQQLAKNGQRGAKLYRLA